MSDFRRRLAMQLTSASRRLHVESPECDFRARLAVSLTAAATELAREHAGERRVGAVAPRRALPWRTRGAGAPAPDFRARLGVQLTAAARLAGERGQATERVAAVAPRGVNARRTRRAGAPAPDFRARLGVQLTAAAAQLAGEGERATGAVSAAPRRSPAPRMPRVVVPRIALMARLSMPRATLLRISRPVAIGLSLSALAGGAAAATLWLPQLGNSRFPTYTDPGASATAPPADQLRALGVLRQPQSSGEQQDPSVKAALIDVNALTTGVRTSSVRVLGTASDGRSIVLVPVQKRRSAGPAQPAIADALCVYYPTQGANGDALATTPHCWSTAQVESAAAYAALGAHVYGLAPDGVSSVTISVPGSAPVVAGVTDNFFDVALAPSGGAPPPHITVSFPNS